MPLPESNANRKTNKEYLNSLAISRAEMNEAVQQRSTSEDTVFAIEGL
jgi:hypothetical protein